MLRRSLVQSEKDLQPVQTPETVDGKRLHFALLKVAEALRNAQDSLTELDRISGDGDLGISLSRGAQAIVDTIDSLPLDDPASTLKDLARTIQHAVGGTSGPLYAIGLSRASTVLSKANAVTAQDWSHAFRAAIDAVAELGDTRVGDRTMIDALSPASKALDHALAAGATPQEAVKDALAAAEAGSQSTAHMLPRRGRASYLGNRVIGHPDPGAEAVVVWLRALDQTLSDPRVP